MPRPWKYAAFADVPAAPDGPPGAEWKSIRRFFGLSAFGVSAYVAEEAGDVVIEEHAEPEDEEVYLVLTGTARFTVDGETFGAPPGTFVFVPPEVAKRAVALEPRTAVGAIGPAGEPSWD